MFGALEHVLLPPLPILHSDLGMPWTSTVVCAKADGLLLQQGCQDCQWLLGLQEFTPVVFAFLRKSRHEPSSTPVRLSRLPPEDVKEIVSGMGRSGSVCIVGKDVVL